MTDERKPEELTEDDMKSANGEPLPPREQMSVIREPMPFTPIEPVTIEPVPADQQV